MIPKQPACRFVFVARFSPQQERHSSLVIGHQASARKPDRFMVDIKIVAGREETAL
jgi:hypothetical protein